ncbi:LPXTG cell wall anchor domain-containing protein [uncultured Gemmiger sp.]|uniref:LPXTG cell wall anchor domain-containing protein n=1 Tax=uncultured Gemmiger sp. TaxID=1623490 RepID=UPI0025D28E66|nr:LPXTG cell wall anchor domain-containing protein [uncultured Gemmiger sp.]
MKKKVLGLLLTLCLVMAFVPMAAFAEGTSVDNWDGSADTSWYTSAPDASEYHISTAEQLAGLAKLVNAKPGTTNFAGKTFYLENDLDLFGHEWISIGTIIGGDCPEYSFCGVFDGQSHVISNLYSHDSDTDDYEVSNNLGRNALFGNVYNGEIKNLGVANAEIWIDPKDGSAAGKGILVDWLGKSKITNCWTSGSIYSGSSIEKNIGGIVGVTVQGCTISGCYSTATLTGNFTNSEGYYRNPNIPPDTIGGIVGARSNGSLTVTDCWFDGKIVVNSIQAAVGGIVGCITTDNSFVGGSVGDANIAIENCMVTTTNMGADEGKKTCWVAYAPDKTVKNCYWPNDKTYNPFLLADVGGASNEEQGTAVSDFTSADVLTGLKNNAGTGVEWVAGISHPTFVWDDNNIPADYTDVNAAIKSATALDSSLYTNYSAVEDAINLVNRAKSKAQQTEVDAMAKAIVDAIAALKYKGANYTKVDAAIAKTKALKKDDYKDFSAVESAVNAVVRDKDITEQSAVDAMAQDIENAIIALQYKDADYTMVDAALAKAKALKKDDYKDFSAVETAVNAVARGKNITEQAEVDAMAKAIEDAIAALQYKDADKTTPAPAATATPAPVATATPAPAATATPQYTIPQTGDTSNPALLVVLMLVSGSAAIGTAVVGSKKKHNR